MNAGFWWQDIGALLIVIMIATYMDHRNKDPSPTARYANALEAVSLQNLPDRENGYYIDLRTLILHLWMRYSMDRIFNTADLLTKIVSVNLSNGLSRSSSRDTVPLFIKIFPIPKKFTLYLQQFKSFINKKS
jgi:hypothetical protein